MTNTLNYIIGTNFVSFTLDGRPVRIMEYDARFGNVMDALTENDLDALKVAIEDTQDQAAARSIKLEGIEATENSVTYHGVELHGTLIETIKRLLSEGKSAERMVKFLARLRKNPSASSVDELYDFMSYKQLPITEDGYLIAYKGVKASGYSIHGNTSTIVVRGQVDRDGHILNEVGSVIEVQRNQVDDDRARGCSFGLHVGSWDYANSFGGYGGKVLTVKVDPADVVSVPTDCNFQKMRVTKYEVLDVADTEIGSAAYEEGESLSSRIMGLHLDSFASTVDEQVGFILNEEVNPTVGSIYAELNTDEDFDFDIEDFADALNDYGFTVHVKFRNSLVDYEVSF